MNKVVLALLLLSTLFIAVVFWAGDPSSARGMYYVVWLAFCAVLVSKRERLCELIKKSPLSEFATFVSLGLLMIFLEETFAGIAVHIQSATDIPSLFAQIPQYYANNFLLLPGFIIAWYILAKRYSYAQKEIYILVGVFGLFAEKIYIHILNFPIMGIALALPTMFTYMGIIAPSLLSLRSTGTKVLPKVYRYTIGFLFPIVVSMPFVLIHALLTRIGIVDPTILLK